MKQKRPFTLFEIMIVICLIGLISGVIGYNMKGSLNEGKAFKTEQAMEQIRDIFELQIAKGFDPQEVVDHLEYHLRHSGIVKNPQKIMRDGWGQPFSFELLEDRDIVISSDKYNAFREKKEGAL